MSTGLVTNPGYGIYNHENNPPKQGEIGHTALCTGYKKGDDGKWCGVCKQQGMYSWVDYGEKCPGCRKRKEDSR